jgi:alkylated DNA repair dioxygenase AlkB
MDTLFSIPPNLPQGFSYFPDFLTLQEEQQLVELIQQYPLENMVFQGFEAKRKVLSFGYDYKFDKRELQKALPIPKDFRFLVEKVGLKLAIEPDLFAKLLLTEYEKGVVINWHRDAPPFDKIAGVSLLCDCTFKLRPYDKSKQARSAIKSFTVARRSLYVMEGAARNEWEHSIAPVKSLRYSITMRTFR